MKRFAASVSLVALGTSIIHAQDAGALSLSGSKPWSASVSLRGFYDDNINSSKNNKVDVIGFEVSPSVTFGIAGDVTSFSVGYTYTGKWYDERPDGNSSNWDHTHIFDAAVQHAFGQRVRVAVSDQFVIGQEPDILRAENVVVGPQRISGDNIRNYGSIIANLQATELLSFEVGYANSYYDYDDENSVLQDPSTLPLVVDPSRSGLLDRMEHSAHIDSRWHVAPQTVAILGYRYGETHYLGDEWVQGMLGIPATYSRSSSRDSRSHFVYVGGEHSFSSALSGSLRAGVQYVDFYNNGTSSLSPYVEGNIRYFYGVESRVELGFSHQRNTTDFIGFSTVVLDADTSLVYGSITHRIVPNFFVSAIGTFQYQTFNGGGAGADDRADRFLLFGLDFSYRFNQHLSAHLGYNFDYLDSDISTRDFTRNRIYLGVTAEY